MYDKQINPIKHDYIYQSLKGGIITEKFADNLISQLNRIYTKKSVKNV